MITEPLTWHTTAERMPDADITVLVTLDAGHDEPTWLAFFDGATWRDVGGHAIKGVTDWADMPAGARLCIEGKA